MAFIVWDNILELVTVVFLFITRMPPKIIAYLAEQQKKTAASAASNFLDFAVYIGNWFLPLKPKGTIIQQGDPGYGGIWKNYQPPLESDSRSPCAYLNALANHGIINRSGRSIPVEQVKQALIKNLNYSKPLAENSANSIVKLFGKDVFDLAELSKHGVVEHDGSVTRADAYFQPDQSIPTKPLINALLASATGPSSPEHPEGYLTSADFAAFASKCVKNSQKMNPNYKGLGMLGVLFTGNNTGLMREVFGGDVRVLRTVLLEERFPDGWETNLRHRLGCSNLELELRSAEILLRMVGDAF